MKTALGDEPLWILMAIGLIQVGVWALMPFLLLSMPIWFPVLGYLGARHLRRQHTQHDHDPEWIWNGYLGWVKQHPDIVWQGESWTRKEILDTAEAVSLD